MKRLIKFLNNQAIEISLTILFILCALFIAFAILTQAKETDVSYKIEDTVVPTRSITHPTKNNLIEYAEQTTVTTTQTTTASTNTQAQSNKGEYVYATEIWNYLRYEIGLNKWCAAGILGNMMTECGGQTLNIQPYITNSSGHYGICQWNLRYFPEVRGKSLHGQLEFLNSTIRWIMNDFGDRYYDGFNYNKFIEITDERIAAQAFAYAYEGSPKPCSQRRLDHATTALNYFEGE